MKTHKSNKKESQGTDGAVEQVADDNLSEDEEIDEDEAFNSDDERRWGHLFGNTSTSSKKRKIDGGDDDDDEDEDDDDDDISQDEDEGIASEDDNSTDGDGGQYMLELLENLDKTNRKPEKGSSRHSSIPESEFSASVLQGTKLTMDQLMSGISNTQKFSSVVKSVAPLTGSDDGKANKLSTAKTPASRIVSERAMRKVQYEEQSKNISLWTEAIQENRRAETLDFRCKERLDVTRDGLVSSFTPTTDFEIEIQKALQEAAATTEEDIQRNEQRLAAETEDDDDLGGVTMTLQEFKKRQGELAKIRALMFYEEIKMHHINKIKSKKYRKIRKKQRTNQTQKNLEARLQGGDDELLKELQEKEEMERVKERMTLAHKNTSKWARQQLARKGKMDLDTRRALSEQIRIGDELRRKMKSIRGNMHDDEEDDDDDDDNNNLIDKARRILQETEEDDEKPANGLFKMAFMQRGLQLQRDRAKEEAKKLLEELEGNNKPDSNDDHDSDGSTDDSQERLTVKSKATTKSSNAAMKPVEETHSSNLPEGKLVVNTLQFGNPNSLEISGIINVDRTSDHSAIAKEAQINKNHFEYNASLRFKDNNTTESTADKKVGQITSTQSVEETKNVANPWLISLEKRNKKNGNKKQQREVVVNVKEAAFVLPILNVELNKTEDLKVQSKSFANSGQTLPSSKSNTRDTTTVNLTQEELVRRAFAAPTEAELEEELNQEKDDLKDKDDPTRKVETAQVVKGWGSWAGEGVVAPKYKSKFPKSSEAPAKGRIEHTPKKTKDPLKKVILNDRRMKKSIKFQIPYVPYPYRSREEYEKAMAGAIGREWNVAGAVKSMSRPEILTTKGRIIKPLSKKAKMKRAPAKF